MMKRFTSLFLLILFTLGAIQAQPLSNDEVLKKLKENKVEKTEIRPEQIDPTEFGNTITAEELEEHLEVLASDEYAGREAGKKGETLAANYMAEYLKSIGIAPFNGSYFQDFGLRELGWGTTRLNIDGKELKFLEDFYCFSGSSTAFSVKGGEIVFVGYGIQDEQYNDYAGLDVKGKVLLAYDGEPVKKGKYLLTGTEEPSAWSRNWRKKLTLAKEKGAVAILIISPGSEEWLPNAKHFLEKPNTSLATDKVERNDKPYAPYLYLTEAAGNLMAQSAGLDLAKTMKKINKKGKPRSQRLIAKYDMQISFEERELKAKNVLGYIEGTDLKDEVIVITAHYDHLGEYDGKIYNGADDDGSGTVALLEMAEAFQLAKEAGKGPRRSILIMPVSAEEKGLLGSRYYTENPVFPMDKTMANLNIDMIGRFDSAHLATGDSNYIYIIGSNFLSRDLHLENVRANDMYVGLDLDYKFNTKDDPNRFYYRSDHYNFVEKGVPAIFYFNGVHEDYHMETDTEEKINYDIMETRTKLIFYTAWRLAMRKAPLTIDGE